MSEHPRRGKGGGWGIQRACEGIKEGFNGTIVQKNMIKFKKEKVLFVFFGNYFKQFRNMDMAIIKNHFTFNILGYKNYWSEIKKQS